MFIIYALNRNLTYEDLYKELSNIKDKYYQGYLKIFC